MSAVRCLVKLLRRLPKEYLPEPKVISVGLPHLVKLLEKASLDTVNLPVEAFTCLSKYFEVQVTEVAY